MRSALKRLGWKQSQLARYLKVTDGAVSMWLSGQRPIPGPVELAVRAAILGAVEPIQGQDRESA